MLQLQPAADRPQPVEPEVRACGWFDSSWELRQGLDVTEHTCPDDAARALGLDGWLMLYNPAAKRKRDYTMIAA